MGEAAPCTQFRLLVYEAGRVRRDGRAASLMPETHGVHMGHQGTVGSGKTVEWATGTLTPSLHSLQWPPTICLTAILPLSSATLLSFIHNAVCLLYMYLCVCGGGGGGYG